MRDELRRRLQGDLKILGRRTDTGYRNGSIELRWIPIQGMAVCVGQLQTMKTYVVIDYEQTEERYGRLDGSGCLVRRLAGRRGLYRMPGLD